ncbi:MAG TPA: hypothetical protein P5531_08715 [Bacteroidales bacterium]|nr:hypothetical protein [Bacteroidales bacterium]HSA43829.1 hypothetical protein [Bacteroidales bacterium]
MEKQNKIPMLYGYAVCLTAVITLIIAVASLVNSLIDRQAPLYAERDYQKTASLASFENYKADILKTGDKENTLTLDDATLRSMFEAARTEKIQSVLHRSNRTIITNGILIVICLALFFTHWSWMGKIRKTTE